MHLLLYIVFAVGQDSLVGIAACYGLGSLGIESWLGRDFPHLSRLVWGPTQPPVQWVASLFPWGKVTMAWYLPPTPV
jgi:hypothetical protein